MDGNCPYSSVIFAEFFLKKIFTFLSECTQVLVEACKIFLSCVACQISFPGQGSNRMDRGDWWATVHEVTKSGTTE